MADNNKNSELGRLEDFIELAKKGKQVEVEVEIKKEFIIQKIDMDGVRDSSSDIETYLLIADYIFKIDDRQHTISKVYMFAAATESADVARSNINIANARLKVDYERLRTANIGFSQKFF